MSFTFYCATAETPTILTIRNPEFGDSKTIERPVSTRQNLGGQPRMGVNDRVEVTTHEFSFTALTAAEVNSLVDIIIDASGLLMTITYTNWNDANGVMSGFIVSPTVDVTTLRDDVHHSLTLTFQEDTTP